MKKYINLSLIFAIYGLCCGVYYREFTKFNDFTDRTMLGMAHPHVLMLGTAAFLIIAIFVKVLNLQEDKKLKIARAVYIAGLIVASAVMLARGTMEVAGLEITNAISASFSGVAGLGHIAVAVGMIMFINIFRKAA